MEKILERVKKVLVKKYSYTLVLILVIFILLGVVNYTSINRFSGSIKINVFGKMLELKDEVLNQNDDVYISLEDLESNFENNVYYDKISRKIIITTIDKVIKLKKDEASISVNYEEVEVFHPVVISYTDKLYCGIKTLADIFGKELFMLEEQKLVYITENDYIKGTTNENRVELYDRYKDKQVLGMLDKNTEIEIEVDDKLVGNSKWINVKITKGAESILTRVQKSKINYEYNSKNIVGQSEEKTDKDKDIVLVAGNKISTSSDVNNITAVTIDTLRLAGVSTIEEDATVNISGIKKSTKVYASVSNGYKLSNYDTNILTAMLNSEVNREKIIQQIKAYLVKNKYGGVVIDFRNFKTTDKELFTQFIKELTAIMHSENKEVFVNLPLAPYIDEVEVSKVADKIIVIAYGTRTLASKTSGTHSSVTYVKESLNTMIQNGVMVDKIILEIPTYSILWTERRGTVINAELYYMSAAKQYIKDNNLKVELDKQSNQNYISFTKGITKYKMWLEDEYSIKEKTNIAKELNISGVSIYKSGFETESIYDIIANNIKRGE